MRSGSKESPTPTAANARSIVTVLDQTKHVKDKVEECATELSSVNDVLEHEIGAKMPLDQLERVLEKSQDVEGKVDECAEDLSVVNKALALEIRERRKLERALAESTNELADAQAELSDSQVQAERSRHLSLHDVVTGLPNRILFNDRLTNALAQAKRHAWRFAVLFIDLDKFKAVNDSYGHDAGDKLLKMIGQRMQTSVRSEDTVARQGGDEFLCLLLETKDETDIAATATKLIVNIAAPCEFDGLTLSVKPSIGIAIYPQDGKSARLLLKNADRAMYKAKQSERGYWFHARGAD